MQSRRQLEEEIERLKFVSTINSAYLQQMEKNCKARRSIVVLVEFSENKSVFNLVSLEKKYNFDVGDIVAVVDQITMMKITNQGKIAKTRYFLT